MGKNTFFDEQTDQSQVKATIVTKYFTTWENIIISTQKKYPHSPAINKFTIKMEKAKNYFCKFDIIF